MVITTGKISDICEGFKANLLTEWESHMKTTNEVMSEKEKKIQGLEIELKTVKEEQKALTDRLKKRVGNLLEDIQESLTTSLRRERSSNGGSLTSLRRERSSPEDGVGDAKPNHSKQNEDSKSDETNNNSGTEEIQDSTAPAGGAEKRTEFNGDVQVDRDAFIAVKNATTISYDGDPTSLMNHLQTPPSVPQPQPGTGISDQPSTNTEPPDLPEIDDKFIDVNSVSIQSVTQNVYINEAANVYLPIQGEDGDAHYKKLDVKENSTRIQESMRTIDEDKFPFETSTLRAFDLVAKDKKGAYLRYLCEDIANFKDEKLQDLASSPSFLNFSSLSLSQNGIDLHKLHGLFSCFRISEKKLEGISLSHSHVNSSHVRALASALPSVKMVDTLDISHCSFECTTFIDLAYLLPYVNHINMAGLTCAAITLVNDIKAFSLEEAKRLAESMDTVSPQKTFGLDLSDCDFRSSDVALLFSEKVFPKASALILKRCLLHEETLQIFMAKIITVGCLTKLDLSCTNLRESGVQKVSKLIGKIKILLLSGVLMDEDAVQPLIRKLLNLPRDQEMDVLDLSFNPIGNGNISNILHRGDVKVKTIIFSKEQITEAPQLQRGSLNKVSAHGAAGEEDFTHWVFSNNEHPQFDRLIEIKEIKALTVEEINRRKSRIERFCCSSCNYAIAFKADSIDVPCELIQNDRSFFGLYENSSFVAVAHASTTDNTSKWRPHGCVYECQIASASLCRSKCKNEHCGKPVGLYYTTDSTKFWCLFRDDGDEEMKVGSTKKAFRNLAEHAREARSTLRRLQETLRNCTSTNGVTPIE